MKPGRPRDLEVTRRVIEVARTQFLKQGFDGLNYGLLARKAGTSRTAIYRRWPSKYDLAHELLEATAHPGALPNTGSLVEDLTAHTMQNAGNQGFVGSGSQPRNLWPVILSPEILGYYMEHIGKKRREIGREIIQYWVDQGELPTEVDGNLILDTLAGLTLFRSVVAENLVTEDQIRTIAVSLCQSPPRHAEAEYASQ